MLYFQLIIVGIFLTGYKFHGSPKCTRNDILLNQTLIFRLPVVSIKLNGKQLGSYISRSTSSSLVLATWKNELFGTPVASGVTLSMNPLRAARINFFFLHRITLHGEIYEHLLASLSWFLYHCEHNSKGKPNTVWCHDLFEPVGLHTLVPVQLIKCRVVSRVCSSSGSVSGESVLLVCPCIE